MYKKIQHTAIIIGVYFKHTLAMKLSFVLLLASCLQVSAFTYAQKISLKADNVPLVDVFKDIKQQSGFHIFYDSQMLRKTRPITVNVSNVSLEEALTKCLSGQQLTYRIVDKNIIITKKREDSTTKEADNFVLADIVVTGKVTDEQGVPLQGVTVRVKDTPFATNTDDAGNFRINSPLDNITLVFTILGYHPEEIAVTSGGNLNVIMRATVSGLDEVVVVGYGTQRKSDLTGAVAMVQGEDLARRKTVQISQALQGATSGVMVTRNNNAPGSSATIRIRGITTIGDNNPLVILDGIPIDNINIINPADIESISVLKDASSASIYGSRAAAGVILVTTKRAKDGQLNISYNFDIGFEKPTELPEYADATRYMRMVNELRWNDNNNNANEYPIYTEDMVSNYDALHAENPDFYPLTDWNRLILNDNAPRQSHSISLMAGTKHVRSNASLVYDKIGALYEGYDYERITARLNNDIVFNETLSSTFDIFYKRNMIMQPTVDPINKMRITAPIYAAEWSDGRVAEGKTGDNIYGLMKYGGFSDTQYNQLGGKISLNFSPLEGLSLQGVFSPLFNFNKNKLFNKQVPYYTWNDPNVFGGYLMGAESTRLNESRTEDFQTTTQFIVNYENSWGDHNFNILGGYENFYFKAENLSASRDQYLLSQYPYLDLGPLEFRDNSGNALENAYRSYFGRLNYNFRSKYLLQANIRYDGSSRFHKDYRWGAFPSVSAGWVITEEPFFEPGSVMSFLKLRASWGTLGNERIGNYPYQSTIAFNNALFYRGGGVVSAQTAAQTQYAIRDISWEKTESGNIGADANFLNGRLSFSGDYFRKTTKDMLLALEIPDYMGYDNPDQNTGKMNTRGWELELGWKDRVRDFNYSVSFNLSDFVSVMGDLGGTEFLGERIRTQGSQFDEWYGYRAIGIYQTQEQVASSAKLNPNVRIGDIQYMDISGPNGVPDGIISPEYDRVLLGGSLPRMMYGGTIRLDYKHVDFSIVFQGVARQLARISESMARPFREQWGNMPLFIDGNYWSRYNSDEQNLSARYPRLSEVQSTNNYTMSDFWLFQGDYFRLKNCTLGYTIPDQLSSKAKIKNLRVYASASDFLTFSKFPKGWDPEVTGSSYPITAAFLFGVSVQF